MAPHERNKCSCVLLPSQTNNLDNMNREGDFFHISIGSSDIDRTPNETYRINYDTLRHNIININSFLR